MNNTPVPQNLPEELLPLYDWWKTKGPKALVQFALAALVAISLYAFWQWRQARLDQASAQITAAQSVDELEAAEARYGSTGAGSLLQLRLARAYYDLSRYDDALAAYNAFLARHASHPFAPVARIGIAATQEAMGDYPAAQASYSQLVAAATPAYLLPEAKLGIVRVLPLSDKKDEAAAQLDAFLADPANKEWEAFARNLKETMRSYKPRARPSLMNLADAIAPVAGKDAPKASENKPSAEAKATTEPVATMPAKVSETKPATAAKDTPKAAEAKPAADAKVAPKASEAKPAQAPAAKPASAAKGASK
ncbi:MAG: hypothetical protein ACI4X9_02200 [Kiritimatiellia bacterium]